ncbi:HAD domain-containing protein [Streptomyces sp. NPDC001691]|uniref:HAD domain-containing protein n=1 Tax=Streptomyces sp. NPDC001691 TaxID=3364600 RepID=UPI0036CD2862
MITPAQRPYLFLDVDGPLIPFGGPDGHPTYGAPGAETANPLLNRLNPAYGPRLARLSHSCDLVWATTWMADANECLAPRLGLPELPVLDWPEQPDEDERAGLHWKTRALLAHAAGRPFIWLDDEITEIDRTWVSAHTGARTLLHRVDPRRGLTDADFTRVEEWLRAAG